ncbi:MAG: 4-alpha-glucanotransferase [Lachnospiraceae bacterium]|nr:4-alpha-glucanotransferase [Lachnospiraceae bacterium]
MRRSGVLLPVSSIPSKYGIGTFSKQAYEFVDLLEKAGQTYWQILPLGPTGYGDSPYQSFSTFAGNPYYIDLETLIDEGYLTKEDCDSYDFGDDAEYIDYEKIYLSRFKVLRTAFENSKSSRLENNEAYQDFVKENSYWLEDYALFMAVKNSFDGISFIEWDEDIRLRKKEAVDQYSQRYKDEIDFYKFQQFLFAKQWFALKEYANKKKIQIIGDIPIYVAFDSSDTWANPELFQLDDNLQPIGVAGCPPDGFSATGQLWGNPLYRWNYHKETGYEWWMKRMAYCYKLYDVVRIDHFRGFDEYYFIPYGDLTAESGHWEKGPGYDFFKTMKAELGKKAVIAEDLGFLTDSVLRLVKKTGYPGMKIMQFAFDSREAGDYLPHNYTRNCVVYTGTHDNDTILGWLQALNRRDKAFAKKYLNTNKSKGLHWEFIRAAMASIADTCIIPMQDYLGLGAEARINIPSTLGLNWKWRMLPGAFDEKLALRIRKMTKLYFRL